MRAAEFWREAWASGISRRVSFLLLAGVGAAMLLTTLFTAGRTAAAEQRVLETIEEAGSRQVQITDVGDTGVLSANVLTVLNGSPSVVYAIGVSAPFDVTNSEIGAGGTKIPVWEVVGPLEAFLTLTVGRLPGDGEAILSADALEKLGLDAPIGSVETPSGARFAIVGAYETSDPDDPMSTGAISGGDLERFATLRVVAADYRGVPLVQSMTLSMIAVQDASDLAVESPVSLAELQGRIIGDLGTANHSLLVVILGSGGILIGAVAYSDTFSRRRELGRRRALGATRMELTALVVARTVIPAALGAVTGAGLGLAVSLAWGQVIPLEFVAGALVLGVFIAVIAGSLPAALAARQDPVRILRLP